MWQLEAAQRCIWAVVLLGVGLDFGADQAEPPKANISVSSEFVPAGGVFDVVANFHLADTVKLYGDSLRFNWTRLEGARFQKLILPEAGPALDPVENKKVPVYTGEARICARFLATGRQGDGVTVEGSLTYTGCTDEMCFLPATDTFSFHLVTGPQVPGAQPTTLPAGLEPVSRSEGQGANFALKILLAFVVGLGMSLTPCVYPTIPIAAAVIGARRGRGLFPALGASLAYVLGLSIVYAVIGLLVAKGGSEVRAFLDAWYVRTPLAALFVFLALVMFAGWNLAVPSGYASRLRSKLAGRHGILSTFAIGAVSALVIGPCITAPLAGLLAYVANEASALTGCWMLFALGWGMGIPLVVFGTATGLLPKAGPWMEWVKRLLGFVLLWAALYFVWPLVGDKVYQVAFALLLVSAAVFVGGLGRFAGRSTFGRRLRNLLGVVAVIYAVFLLVSAAGLIPGTAQNVFKPATDSKVKQALSSGRRVILDFYTDSCAGCRELDRTVFTRPEVLEAAQGILTLKVNATEQYELADRYNLKGVPTILFIGPDGQVRKDLSFAGKKSLAQFLTLLKQFKK